MTWTKVAQFAARVLGILILQLSPEIRELVEGLVERMWEKAQKTDNAFDDIFVTFLAEILDIELSAE
jgi:hypothetical protein